MSKPTELLIYHCDGEVIDGYPVEECPDGEMIMAPFGSDFHGHLLVREVLPNELEPITTEIIQELIDTQRKTIDWVKLYDDYSEKAETKYILQFIDFKLIQELVEKQLKGEE